MSPPEQDGPVDPGSTGGAVTNSLAQLSKAARRISATRGVERTLEAIAEEARSLVGAHQSVASLTAGQNWAQRISAVSLSDDYAAWRAYHKPPDGSGIYSLVCETNRPLRLTQAELEAHPRWCGYGAEAERHPPMRGWLAAPFVGRRGENIGVVQLSDKNDGAEFTEHDENVLVQLAEIAAISVENARLYEAAQAAREQGEWRLREVQAEQAQLAEIFRNAPSFMCILSGPEHVIERANDHYLALVGHRSIVGKPVTEALPEIRRQGFVELLDHVFHTGETYIGHDVSIVLSTPSERSGAEQYETRWLDFVYQPIRNAEGTITGIYVQGVDLTERKLVEQALRESEQRLIDINTSLEQRVAERTAELEERAAQLRALATELTQTEQRERRRIGDILHDNVQQLLVAGRIQLSSLAHVVTDEDTAQRVGRVDDLLVQAIDASRSLTAGLIPPVLYDAGLTAALASLGRWMEAQQGLRVEVSASQGAEPAGEDLRAVLFQAVRELLFNVLKHAKTDRAEVSLRRSDGMIEATVADSGEGFDATSALANAQDRFGLFSMRERMSWLGGEMSIASIPGEGTRVVLALPDDHGSASEVPAHPCDDQVRAGADDARPFAFETEACATRITVVVADDHAIVRKGLVDSLAGEPDIAVVGEAGDGQEAVELVRRARPDVVVLDVTMPRMSGIEAARAIAAEFPGIRVLGLSVHESADLAEAMHSAGAVAYLNKAQAPESLLAAVRGEDK